MFYDDLINLYIKHTGYSPAVVTPITGSGSGRKYYRLSGTVNLIGVIGTSVAENRAFIYESRFFKARGINVPEVVAVSDDSCCYLQQDLGPTNLYDLLKLHGEDGYMYRLCEKALSQLAAMQFLTDGFDWSTCYPVGALDRRAIMWDLNYFKYCFLKPSGCELDEQALEEDFEKLSGRILNITPAGLMYRDFQSRNVMVVDDEPWFIDFQGARRGPVLYDAVSFLWQARANFSRQFREKLLSGYISDISSRSGIDSNDLYSHLDEVILFRMLQVLGVYGFRGNIERKSTFLGQIPVAINTCREVLLRLSDYPGLTSMVEKIAADLDAAPRYDNSKLTVSVSSFSYKKGIPVDSSGNGGGFVFDCRAIHNPGRYEPYRQLTGDDLPVIQFLEQESNIFQFLDHCYALVDASVEKYMERGFTSLVVNFGCTGGQHRSVYSASHMARHLHDKYGIKVVLEHREQNIKIIME